MKIFGLIAVLVMVAVLTGLYFYLPVYLQNHLIPKMVSDAGLSAESVTIRRVSPWGADLGVIKLTGGDGKGFSIKAIQITYSPWSLFQKSIDTLDLIGCSIDTAISDDGICIGGICIPTAKKENESDVGGQTDFDTFLPVRINRITVRDGRLNLMWSQHEMVIPFDINLLTSGLNQGKLEGDVALSPRDNLITADLTFDSHANQAGLKLKASGLVLDRFSDLWRSLPEIRIRATADIEAQISAQLNPPAVKKTELAVHLTDFSFLGNGIGFGPMTDPATGANQPVSVHLTGIGDQEWQLICGSVVLQQPSIVQIPAIRADISLDPTNPSMEARLETRLTAQTLAGQWHVTSDRPMTVKWQLHATRKGQDRIDYRLVGDAEGALPFSLKRAPVEIRGNGFHINATGWARPQEVDAKIMARTGPVQVQAAPTDLRIPEIILLADTHWFKDAQATDKMTVKGDISLPKPVVTHGTLFGGAAAARISARIETASKTEPKVTGVFYLRDGYIKESEQKLTVSEIGIKMPFGLPATASHPKGTLQANVLRWHTYEKGSISGDLMQTDARLDFNAAYTSQLRPGLRMDVNGSIDQAGGRMAFTIPAYQPEKKIDLGQFIPSAAGFIFQGSLTGAGDLMIDQGGLKGSAKINVDGAALSKKDDALSIEGISVSLTMPHLPDLRSAPRQPLSASHVQLGEISTHDFKAYFQLEPPGTFFIEKADVQWCNGSMHTQSIRLGPDNPDIELTLFANQLNLAQVLEQLGVTEGEGEGAVNGRIPLRVHKGVPVFDNGFLYSTPGQGGTIHLRDTQSLLQGMPKQAPQFIQLDIATEALKDYTYNWARLSLNSEKDILKVGLKLSGKPNQLLPFTYDKETEQFQRIEGEPIADFQEIGFDLNFSSSLSQILQYKALFKQKK